MSFRDHVKKWVWYIVAPIFPFVRDLSRFLGINWYAGRQPYHLGWLRKDRSIDAFKTFLKNNGFHDAPVAWVDDGEVFGLRLRENFRYQYHVRVFDDGEVREHHELTPEYSPIDHLRDKETSSQKEKILKIIGDWITTEK
jgi:hypothetical protein